MKLMDTFDCTSGALTGAWWLVEGADIDGYCVISWALTNGANQKRLGFT